MLILLQVEQTVKEGKDALAAYIKDIQEQILMQVKNWNWNLLNMQEKQT